MPIFTYRALNSQGQEVKSEIEAKSSEDAASKLREQKLFPTSVKEKTAKRLPGAKAAGPTQRKKGLVFGKVKTKQLSAFTRQLSTLINAGLPVVRSLRVLGDQLKPGPLKNDVLDVADDVESGSSLSEALAKHPKTFNKLYVNMVRAGEAGGILDQILERLSGFMEKAERLKKRVVSAMIYPAAVITVAGAILMVIVGVIVPQFQKMFKEMNMVLPVPTQILMGFGEFVKSYWFIIVAIPFGIIALYRLLVFTKSGRYGVDYVKLKLPIFGMIVNKSSISRFARTLGTLITSGVPILEALNIVKDATPNVVIQGTISKVHDSIREGETMAAPLGASKVIDPMVVNMVDVGEETGELDKMLVKVADTYDEDVDALVGGMMSLIEPMLIVGLGSVAGFMVISLFMPLIDMMKSMGKQ